jgi:hypothetical protein
VLGKQIAEKVQDYLGDAQRPQNLIADFLQSKQGKDAIAAAIAEKMNSLSVKQLVRDSIDEALKPAVGMLMNDLRSSAARTIVQAGALAINPEFLAKGGPIDLEMFLRYAHVQPVVMTLTVGGNVPYSSSAWVRYNKELRQALGSRFLGTLLNDNQGRFLGLLDPNTFDKPPPSEKEFLLDQLVDRINHGDVLPVPELLEKLQSGSSASVTETMTLAKSLRDGLWTRLSEPNQPVAVLTADRHFRGVTTRKRLLSAVSDAGDKG